MQARHPSTTEITVKPLRTPRVLLIAAAGFVCLTALPSAWAQPTYSLDPTGVWTQSSTRVAPTAAANAADPDQAVMDRARSLVANERFSEAREILDGWIEANAESKSPYLPEAYLLRGDARLGMDEEYNALIDYERVVKFFPSSEMFAKALERELDIAIAYLNGLRKRSLGIRIDSGVPLAEEIIIRINERLPGSRLGERALLILADHYYRKRDLRGAIDTYEAFQRLFPRSSERTLVMERLIYAQIGQFKGPRYDASGLQDAQARIAQLKAEAPAVAERSGIGEALEARLDESRAAQMLSVAEWYMKRKDAVAARLHLRRLIERHPKTAAANTALRALENMGWSITKQPAEPVLPVSTEPAASEPAPADEGAPR